MSTLARRYLIGPGDLNPGWMPLYAATFALQFLLGWVRSLFAALVFLIVNLLTVWILGLHLPIDLLALAVGFGPLLVSLATLILPLGGWWFQQQEGGRRPSEREQAVFDTAFAELRAADPALRPPQRWFVTDGAEANACVYGNTLLASRALLASAYFPAVLAHELGHLNSSDGRVTAAVYRLTIPPRGPVQTPFGIFGWLTSGRAGMALVKAPWAMYWRHSEASADAYAAKLGHADALADYLDSMVWRGICRRRSRHSGTARTPGQSTASRGSPPTRRTSNGGPAPCKGRPCGAALRAGAGAPPCDRTPALR